jgi:hypothetical protein
MPGVWSAWPSPLGTRVAERFVTMCPRRFTRKRSRSRLRALLEVRVSYCDYGDSPAKSLVPNREMPCWLTDMALTYLAKLAPTESWQ